MNHIYTQSTTLAFAKTAHALQGLIGDEASSLLLISPHESDHCAFAAIFAATPWTLHFAYTWEEAQECLEENSVAVVVCDSELPDGNWRSVLKGLVHVSCAPLLIVASRLADERLWAEVLNHGAYDVILKPFEPAETRFAAGTACWKWQHQHSRAQLVC